TPLRGCRGAACRTTPGGRGWAGPQRRVRAAGGRVGAAGRAPGPGGQGRLRRRRRRHPAQRPVRHAGAVGGPPDQVRPRAVPVPGGPDPPCRLHPGRRSVRLLSRRGRDHRPRHSPQPWRPARLGERRGGLRPLQPPQGGPYAHRARVAAAHGAPGPARPRVAGAGPPHPGPAVGGVPQLRLTAPDRPQPWPDGVPRAGVRHRDLSRPPPLPRLLTCAARPTTARQDPEVSRLTAQVTGGTGTAGRELVRRLRDRGTQVRVLSRRPSSQPGHCQGDLDTGQGLAAAVAGVDVIAHCATAADYRRRWRDTQGTRRLLAALGDARPHLVYLSIVGVDRIPLRYYADKL